MPVAFDAIAPSAAGQTGFGTSTSWTHTCTGANLALVVVFAVDSTADGDTLTVTADGVALTSARKVHINSGVVGFVQLLSLAGLSAGTHTVAVSWTNGANFIGGSMSYTGVDQTTALVNSAGLAGTGVSASASVTSATDAMEVWGCAALDALSAPSKTSRFSGTSAALRGAAQDAAGAASTTAFWTVNADQWAVVGAEIQPAASTPALTVPDYTAFPKQLISDRDQGLT